ncbi:uncharacterized protein EI90DRAFT_3065771 [Cantharellus anzutake]|uniref:uncharacterized protein n=1 Tax=Cantharellus anzutake TaxID=1750568 RepID=UPI0019048D17|nr:uncharacterized protein EI90DRAFT_3065771 [Cantharellus anzutake]KAF8328163.1 hypothetical protein EI90DRAFT_3065771 [Cantharellus anzutake]
MPLKPCLKSGHHNPSSGCNSNNHPPIPIDSATSTYGEYSALPYAQPFVHFPPSPTLTSTHVVDDSRIYDRTPIVVAENDCALPQRGCPGRTYIGIERRSAPRSASPGNHLHPSAARFSNYSMSLHADPSRVPSLTSDETSSDDSDGAVPTPPEFCHPSSSGSMSPLCHSLCNPDHHSPCCQTQRATLGLSFPLPHPSDPPRSSFRTPITSNTSSNYGSSRYNHSNKFARDGPTFASALDSSCLGGF